MMRFHNINMSFVPAPSEWKEERKKSNLDLFEISQNRALRISFLSTYETDEIKKKRKTNIYIAFMELKYSRFYLCRAHRSDSV